MGELSELSWPQVHDLAAGGAILAVPLGSTEQHGPHLPLSTDADIALALCRSLAAARPDVLVAPVVPYGSSGEHAGFAGTLSIGQAALEHVVVELGRSAGETFDHVLFVSAHGGNAEAVTRAVDVLRTESRDVALHQPHWRGDPHAGHVETSLQLYLHPELVAMSRSEAGDVRPLAEVLPLLRSGGVRAVSANGVLGDPTGANSAAGAGLFEELVAALIEQVATWRPLVGTSGGAARHESPRAVTSRQVRVWRSAVRNGVGSGAAVNRVALVTGAARGIGAATVTALAAAGWSVLAVDLCADDATLPYTLGTRAELDAVVAAAGDRVMGFQADVRDVDAMSAAVATAEQTWGGLDAALAIAGVIAGGAPQWKVPIEQERAVLDVNLGGVLTLARVAVPALLRRPEPRSGRFLAVASAAAIRGLPMLAAYCAAKAGVAGLVRALGVELGGTGITANAVSPGSTATPILTESARLYGLACGDDFAAQQPLQRLLDPAEIAAVLVFLAGTASAAMTGAVVPVDGGLAL